jgi:choline dehydrogenase-like flavoprotein
MIVDARTLSDGTGVEADLAIIGGGPAGITLARAFDASGVDVCLVEAGGLEADADVQSFYQGESVGIEYPLDATRLRFLGGSSNHWGGYCRPLDPIDFEQRDWVPYSGWPFGIEELAPYYPQATEIVEVSPGRYSDVAFWESATGTELPKPVTGRMRRQFVHFSPPTRFGKRYRPQLERSGNIRVLLNATVTNIAAAPEGRHVDRLELQTVDGKRHSVTARYFVVATGGLENARMLLLSNDVMTSGLGNQNDLVGRFFMEHPHISGFGEIVVADLGRLPPLYRDRVWVEGLSVKVAFNPDYAFMRERRLLNATFMSGVAGEYRRDSDTVAGQLDMLRAARRFLADGSGPVKPDDPDYLGVPLGLGCAGEQAPNPSSRVSLSQDRDAFGLPRIKLDWQLTEQDRRSLMEHMRSLAMEYAALGIGRMRLNIEDDGIWPERVDGGSHHMGTTRMHDDPEQGVVDRDSRVHGIDNLYVAGSSVFPTGGSANPTLTIVALTLRLADHLRTRLP